VPAVKLSPTTAMERHVAKWLRSQAKSYPDTGMQGAVNDLLHGGCAAGTVGHLIYTTDILRFYRTHRAEIAALLTQTLDDTGCESPAHLFRDWDKSDPFAHDSGNQTTLAHFAFEETARALCAQAGLDV
jgi:hypothetical protein